MANIYIFGSNTQGRHGKGAALIAKLKYGAIQGQARGLQGNSYAIVTKDLTLPKHKQLRSVPLTHIALQVDVLLNIVKSMEATIFILSPIGCGNAGYTPEEIAPMFKNAPLNIILPREFASVLNKTETK